MLAFKSNGMNLKVVGHLTIALHTALLKLLVDILGVSASGECSRYAISSWCS